MADLFFQSPNEGLDYSIGWADYLPDGVTISSAPDSSVWTVPSGITIEEESHDTTTAFIRISAVGSPEGIRYVLLNHVILSDGQQPERTLEIEIFSYPRNTLTGPQKVTVAEITYEEYATINGLATALNADQVTSIVADLATWALIRDSHVKLAGGRDGVDFDNERKRVAIRGRIRLALGLPLIPSALCPIPSVYAGGISLTDMETRSSDSDRPSSAFTSDLHSS